MVLMTTTKKVAMVVLLKVRTPSVAIVVIVIVHYHDVFHTPYQMLILSHIPSIR